MNNFHAECFIVLLGRKIGRRWLWAHCCSRLCAASSPLTGIMRVAPRITLNGWFIFVVWMDSRFDCTALYMVWICIDSFYLETETFIACHCLEKPHLTYLSLCLLIHRSESTVLNVRLQLVKGKWALMLTHQVSIYGWIWYATRRMLVTSQLLFPMDFNRFITIQFHLIAKNPFSTEETKTFHKDDQF